MTTRENILSSANVERFQQHAMKGGMAGLGACLLWGILVNPPQFFYAYLMSFLFWLGLALGCMSIVMLHHLVGGAWGAMILRILEAGMRTLPLMLILAIPLVFGLQHLYVWAQPDVVATDTILQHKSGYLNVPFFLGRSALYFAIWIGMAHYLSRWSHQHEATDGQSDQPRWRQRLRRLSAPGLGIYALTVSFASIDWAMSLEPHWYSTLYGVIFVVGQALCALTFATVVIALLADTEPLGRVITPARVHDLGNLIFAFVLLWAYMNFSQFLIIWAGNLAEEVTWYLHRTQGGWESMAFFLVVFHFTLPFLLLLTRHVKRKVELLAIIAAVIFSLHLVTVFWFILPALHPAQFHIHWMDVVAPLGMGGIWLTMFVRNFTGHSAIPLEDRRLQGVPQHG